MRYSDVDLTMDGPLSSLTLLLYLFCPDGGYIEEDGVAFHNKDCGNWTDERQSG
jgi:hypothetical protein